MISSSYFSTDKSHARSCLNRATWEHEKKNPRNRSWEFLKKFLGTLQKVPGNQNLFTWLQTAERNNSQELFMEPNFFTWHKTQVSAMFPRTFPGIETASSWDLCPACQGSGGGLETARGTLGQPRSFIGRLGVFVMSLWQCWFIQFDLLDSKLQPFHDHYALGVQTPSLFCVTRWALFR